MSSDLIKLFWNFSGHSLAAIQYGSLVLIQRCFPLLTPVPQHKHTPKHHSSLPRDLQDSKLTSAISVMSDLLKLNPGGVAVFLSTNPKVFTWKDTKMWFFGSHEYGGQGRWRVSTLPRCRECALSLENVLSDLGPNKPIHSLASAKLRFLKHRESLGQGQKVQTSYDSPPSAADRPGPSSPQLALPSSTVLLTPALIRAKWNPPRFTVCFSSTEPLLRPPWQLVSILTVPVWAELSTFFTCLLLFSFLLHMITLGE